MPLLSFLIIYTFDSICVDSSTCKKIYSVTLPVTNVTSCAFGGPDLNELYITTATVALSDQQLEQQPLASSLFKAKVPYKGRPAFWFSL
jgi:sugar lactone lactonase YvrE